tara:strand:+ start:1782 stop:5303 length:3522 start_codon:yes stop_codon:yes gene_type:complete
MPRTPLKELSNPFSTAGGGVNFETRVQASFAVLMLAGGYSPCARPWPISAVHLQAKHLGFDTDDLVVEAQENGTGRKSRVLAQIKHDVSFTVGNKTFGEVVASAWYDFENSVDAEFDAIVLITGPLSGTDLELRTLLEWARSSTDHDDFFNKVKLSKFSSSNKQAKLAATLHHLKAANGGNAVTEATAWRFLKSYHVLQYDLDIAGGVNRALLSCIIAQFGASGADATWAQVVEAVRDINQSAGSITADTLPRNIVETFNRRPKTVISKELLEIAAIARPYARPPTSFSSELAVAQFVGTWSESSAQDRLYVSELAGETYDEFVRKLGVELNVPDPVIQHKHGVWSVIDRRGCWDAFGTYIFDRHIEILGNHAQLAFSEDNRALLSSEQDDMPLEESNTYSRKLRAALADTLAFLTTSGASLVHCRRDLVEGMPHRVVGYVLKNANWLRLASLNDVMPVLAEAAPETFLEALERVLGRSETLEQLFSKQSGGVFGTNYTIGILWGLENLAWSPEHLGRATLILGGLNSHDPGGRWGNRPIESLKSIFLPWHPQTAATSSGRITALQALSREYPEAAWAVYLAALPGVTQSTSGTHRPKFQNYSPEETPTVTRREYASEVNSYSDHLLQLGAANVSRLVSLSDHLSNLPPQAFSKAIALIEASADQLRLEKQDYAVWSKLEEIARKHTAFSHTDWAMSPALVTEVQGLAAKLKPIDPSELYRDRFDGTDITFFDREVSWQERQNKLEKLQAEAVQEIWNGGGLQGTLAFARSVRRPRAVGHALAKIETNPVSTSELRSIAAPDDVHKQEFLLGFVAQRFAIEGTDWLDRLRLAEWEPDAAAQMLSGLPFVKSTWALVEKILPDDSLYWKSVDVRLVDDEADLHFLVRKLLQNERPISAVDALHSFLFRHKTLNVSDAIEALLAVGKGDERPSQLDGYEIESIILHLQQDSGASVDDLQRIEWAYLDLIVRPGSQTFPKTLEQRLASDPDFFLEVIAAIFRPKDAPAKEPTEEEQKIASAAYRLLMDWRVPPGQKIDAGFSGERFLEWFKEVVTKAEATGYLDVATQQIGQVLIHVPVDEDGFWIDMKVAEALNSAECDQLRSGYRIGLYNSRGVHWVDPNGGPERELAAKYNEQAIEADKRGLFRLAGCVRGLSKEYARDAGTIAERYGLEDEE